MYAPRVGRFVSADPLGFKGGNNLWVYVNNNPLRYTDPTGRLPAALLALLGAKAFIVGIDTFVWFQNIDYHCEKLCPGNGQKWPFPSTFQVLGYNWTLFQYKPKPGEEAIFNSELGAFPSFSWGDCFYQVFMHGEAPPPITQ